MNTHPLLLALPLLLPQAPAQEAGPAPYTQELDGTTLSFVMRPIPGGTLEVPATEDGAAVSLEVEPFFMAELETTWDLYDVLVFGFDRPRGEEPTDGVTRPTKPYIAADHGFGHSGYPALSISHNGAKAYVAWLRAKTGRAYRLPTEQEWEWAARAGSPSRWFFGDDEEELERYAWIRTNSSLVTHPVGEKEPSPWGLRDVYGNVGEWCMTDSGGHVLRGGAYLDRWKKVDNRARKIPSPAWNANDPQIPQSIWWLTDGSFAGFRVVCDMEDGEPAPAR